MDCFWVFGFLVCGGGCWIMDSVLIWIWLRWVMVWWGLLILVLNFVFVFSF